MPPPEASARAKPAIPISGPRRSAGRLWVAPPNTSSTARAPATNLARVAYPPNGRNRVLSIPNLFELLNPNTAVVLAGVSIVGLLCLVSVFARRRSIRARARAALAILFGSDPRNAARAEDDPTGDSTVDHDLPAH